MNIPVIKYRNFFASFSILLTLVAAGLVFYFGLKPGIDFSGGTMWRFQLGADAPTALEVERIFHEELNLPDARVNYDSVYNTFLARLPVADQKLQESLIEAFQTRYPSFSELSFQSIGPSVGEELRDRAVTSMVLVLIAISLYIAFAFRKVFRPISSWKYGIVTLLTLFHDVVIPAALLAVLGKFYGLEIDGNFVVALLVVMGFSVHDTIVIFDRIRENLLLDRGRSDFGVVIGESVNQTIARSINTSLTLILVLLALYFVGPINLQNFVLTLLVGSAAGIYSSIFLASPLLYLWHEWGTKKAS